MKILNKAVSSLVIAAVLAVPVFFNPGNQAKAATIMKVGSSGSQVAELQQNLKKLGYFTYSDITGYYGTITRYSVIKFQSANNLSADGMAGPATLTKLNALLNSNWSAHYTVQSGDSLYFISQRYGTTIGRLMSMNNLTSYTIYPGQVLIVPSQGSNQSTQVLSESQNADIYWLSRIINAEAEGEPYEGKVAVGNVIINRKASPDFPNTIKGVIFEYYKGIPQFSPVAEGTIYNTPSQESIRAAKDALNGSRPVGSATYFFNPDKAAAPWIVNNKTYVTRLGNHVFYR